jgi:hypothetical protein
MKKKPQLDKKTIKHLKLKLKQISERKVAPAIAMDRSNSLSCAY